MRLTVANGEYSLGICYLHGEGVEQNPALARKWICLPLAHGDGARSTNAMGLTYKTGPEQELTETFNWYNKAATMGYAEAQYNVCGLTAPGLVSAADCAGGKLLHATFYPPSNPSLN